MDINIVLDESLTIKTIEKNHAEWLSDIGSSAKNISLDGAALKHMDTAGIQLLISLAKKAHEMDAKLHINNFSKEMEDKLCLSGFTEWFQRLPD